MEEETLKVSFYGGLWLDKLIRYNEIEFLSYLQFSIINLRNMKNAESDSYGKLLLESDIILLEKIKKDYERIVLK